MAEISIQIDWVYALGILGTLLVMAWQAGSRFARIDTLLKNLNEKVKDTEDRILEVKRELSERIDELKNDLDNVRFNIFANHSPIHLTEDGILHLQESGMKEYIDTHTEELMERFPDAEETNPYEIQEFVFDMFRVYDFGESVEDKLKRYSFASGVPIDLLRRAGAIYFRDLYLQKHNIDGSIIEDNEKEIQ